MVSLCGKEDLDIIVLTSCILFLVIFPLALFIWALLTMANTIQIDENGIARYRFGKKIKMFQWSEVRTIGSTSESLFTGWCYISNENKKFDYSSITKMRLDKSVIYFHLSEKAINALKIYSKNIKLLEKAFNKTD